MKQDDGVQRRLQRAVDNVVAAALQWAGADYGDPNQLRVDAELADAVREYERAQAAAPSMMGKSVLRPDRLDV